MRDSFDFGYCSYRVSLNRINVSLLTEEQGGGMFIKWDKMLQEGYQM
jgi:hypothetical protein